MFKVESSFQDLTIAFTNRFKLLLGWPKIAFPLKPSNTRQEEASLTWQHNH